MKLNHLLTVVAVLCLTMLFTACMSKEKRTINELENLAVEIEDNGKNYDADDWADAIARYEDIHEDMTRCDFSKEQLREIGRIDGRLTALYARAALNGYKTILDDMSVFTDGFAEGLDESGVDFDGLIDELTESTESFSDQIDALFSE